MRIKRFVFGTGWVNLKRYTDVLGSKAKNVEIYGLAVGKKYGIILFKDKTQR